MSLAAAQKKKGPQGPRQTKKNSILAMVVVAVVVVPMRGTASEPRMERPSSVPSTAVWIGGDDGGYYYVCNKNLESLSFYCRIYNDQNGNIEYDGEVSLSNWENLKYRNAEEFYDDISAFDGNSIYLVSRVKKQLGHLRKP